MTHVTSWFYPISNAARARELSSEQINLLVASVLLITGTTPADLSPQPCSISHRENHCHHNHVASYYVTVPSSTHSTTAFSLSLATPSYFRFRSGTNLLDCHLDAYNKTYWRNHYIPGLDVQVHQTIII
ncbi:hypothetical protein J6590_036456 [Homalodisca vitripennis]|nr:hypothetical protein J6590_036456 [Homalodisca vitripennis]